MEWMMSNQLNRQVPLSFIFFCCNVSCSWYQLCNSSIERYVAGNLQSSLKEGRVAVVFQSPRIQSLLCEWASTWLTVVLLLWTLCITTDTVHLSVKQGHGSQLPMISSMSVKDGKWKHPWESPCIVHVRVSQERFLCLWVVDIVTIWHFFQYM